MNQRPQDDKNAGDRVIRRVIVSRGHSQALAWTLEFCSMSSGGDPLMHRRTESRPGHLAAVSTSILHQKYIFLNVPWSNDP